MKEDEGISALSPPPPPHLALPTLAPSSTVTSKSGNSLDQFNLEHSQALTAVVRPAGWAVYLRALDESPCY